MAMPRLTETSETTDAQTQAALTEGELARRWRVSPRTLQRWRAGGRGPAFLRLGRRIVYEPDAVARFEAAVRHGGEAAS
jgi:hypothetical protein